MTALIWKWLGMASIGAFAAMTIGLIIAASSAVSVYKKSRLTDYHKWIYFLSIGYIGFVLFTTCASLIYNGIQ